MYSLLVITVVIVIGIGDDATGATVERIAFFVSVRDEGRDARVTITSSTRVPMNFYPARLRLRALARGTENYGDPLKKSTYPAVLARR